MAIGTTGTLETGAGEPDRSFKQDFDSFVDADAKAADTQEIEAAAAAVEAKVEVAETAETKADEVNSQAQPERTEAQSAQAAQVIQPEQPTQSALTIDTLNDSYEKLTEEIAQQYEDKKISYKDAQKQQARLNTAYQKELNKLHTQENDTRLSQQAIEKEWQAEQQRFFTENADLADDVLKGALAAALNQLYKEPASDSKSQAELLAEAADRVRKKFGMTTNNADKQKADELSAKRAEKLARNATVTGKHTEPKAGEPTDKKGWFDWYVSQDAKKNQR